MSIKPSVVLICFAMSLVAGQEPKRTILTSAHRGEHLHHPENSLPAIQAAIDAGIDYVELDVRTTADGQLVLMHDPTINRMTSGKGAVAKMTLAELKQLDLGARFPGQFPDCRVPTFDEALALAKGRIGIYVDTKAASPEALVETIERHGMGSNVMFWSESVPFLKSIRRLRPAWVVMPEAFNPKHARMLLDELHPTVIGYDDRDFNQSTVAVAREAGVGIFVDRQTEKEWAAAIEMGATGIQTDHPVELAAYLRAHGYHR